VNAFPDIIYASETEDLESWEIQNSFSIISKISKLQDKNYKSGGYCTVPQFQPKNTFVILPSSLKFSILLLPTSGFALTLYYPGFHCFLQNYMLQIFFCICENASTSTTSQLLPTLGCASLTPLQCI